MLTIGLILIVALIAYLLISNQEYLTSLINGTNTNNPLVSEQNKVKEVIVSGSNFKFNPTEIRVNQGDQVKITFRNIEGTHDWKLDEFNVGTPVISASQEQSVTFTADKTGTFEYYCSVGNHRQMGMVGNLIVE